MSNKKLFEEPLLSAPEAAKEVGACHATLLRYAHEGLIPYRKFRTHYKFRLTDIKKFIAKAENNAKSKSRKRK